MAMLRSSRLFTVMLCALTPALAPTTASAQTVRDTIRSEHFTARALGVEAGENGGRWLIVEFTAGTISPVETLIVRGNDLGCNRPAFLSDAEGRRFVEARCTGSAEPLLAPAKFDESGQKQTVRFHFVSPQGVTSQLPPYDAVVPLLYRITGEADRPVPETGQILAFFGVGK